MAVRKPIVSIAGQLQELPTADLLAQSWIHFGWALSGPTANLAAALDVWEAYVPFPCTLDSVMISVGTPSVGAAIQVDANKNGTSIFSTVPSIDVSEDTSLTAASAAVFSTTAFAAGDRLNFDIDQVGSSTPGKRLEIHLWGRLNLS